MLDCVYVLGHGAAKLCPAGTGLGMDTIKPKRSLTEETYEILVDAICNGELTPGERLTQEEIAARLNVSRQPVNSAFSILKTHGLVVDTGRRGVTVAALDPALFGAIFEYRCVIEPFAARLACERTGQKAREEADEILQDGETAVVTGNIRALVNADMRFHQAIYRWSGNEVIQTSMQVNWHHIRRTMTDVLRHPRSQRDSWTDHGIVADAICAGDGGRASEAMENHISKAYQTLSADLRKAAQ